MKILFILLVYMFILIHGISAQFNEEKPSTSSSPDFDEILSQSEDESQAKQLYEELLTLRENPLNINTCTEAELEKIIYLNDFQIFSILEYRKETGIIYSLSELSLISGLQNELIEKIRPYLFAGPSHINTTGNQSKKLRLKSKILVRTQLSHPNKYGFSSEADSSIKFLGSRHKDQIKYQIEVGDKYRGGINLEKDEGEKYTPFSQQHPSGFSSAFIEMNNPGKIRKIILGDYRISSANGLIFGYGMNGKSTGFILSSKLPSVSKYSSAAENGFYRGMAIHLETGKFTAIVYGSGRKRDANVSSISEKPYNFTSFKVDGLSRNAKEIAESKNIFETASGLLLGLNTDRLNIGYTLQNTLFNANYSYRIRPDRYSELATKNHFLLQSLHYSFRQGDLLVFGELAAGLNKKIAAIQAMTVRLHSLLTASLSLRYFDPEYISFTSSAFGEANGTRNESGYYIALDAYPFSFLKTSIYMDIYRFPWLRYTNCAPINGNDIVLKNEIRFNRDFEIVIFMKKENSYVEITHGNPEKEGKEPSIKQMETKQDHRLVLQAAWRPVGNFSFKTRLELKKTNTNHGVQHCSDFMSQDANLILFSDRLRLSFRFAVFNIPDWSVRIYAWEQDLLYSFSSPAFYRQGTRYYAVARIALLKNLNLWFKYAATSYRSFVVTGTGADLRKGALFEEWKIQIQWKIY